MTARDRWITVKPTGEILLNSENDGWTYLRKGPDTETVIVTLDQLHGTLLKQAIYGLKQHGFSVGGLTTINDNFGHSEG